MYCSTKAEEIIAGCPMLTHCQASARAISGENSHVSTKHYCSIVRILNTFQAASASEFRKLVIELEPGAPSADGDDQESACRECLFVYRLSMLPIYKGIGEGNQCFAKMPLVFSLAVDTPDPHATHLEQASNILSPCDKFLG